MIEISFEQQRWLLAGFHGNFMPFELILFHSVFGIIRDGRFELELLSREKFFVLFI